MNVFNNKRIKELEEKIGKMKNQQEDFIRYTTGIMKNLQDSNKAKYMYELQQEDVDLIKDGEILRKIRKILI